MRSVAKAPVGGAPSPIPGGIQIDPFGFFHLFLPTDTLFPNHDIQSGEGDSSTITDFNGQIGVFEPFGGTGGDNNGLQQFWAADVLFFNGEYLDATASIDRAPSSSFDSTSSPTRFWPIRSMTSAPGISPNGMFWTTAIPRGSVHANPGKGRASLNVTDLAVVDAFNIVNVLSGGPNIPATVSFTCTWGGPGERVRFFNADVGFAGNYVQNTATVQWSASNADGYQFTSEPFSAGFSIVGRSRDDVFGPEPRRASAAVVPHSQCVTAA